MENDPNDEPLNLQSFQIKQRQLKLLESPAFSYIFLIGSVFRSIQVFGSNSCLHFLPDKTKLLRDSNRDFAMVGWIH